MRRRRFLQGLGGGSVALGALGHQLLAQAYGDSPDRVNLVVLSTGNGWGHQGMKREGEILDTTVVDEDDWVLPAALSPLAGLADRVSILRPFRCPGDGNLHGSGWSTLTCLKGDGINPNGRSLDRLVGLDRGATDPFSSVALGISHKAGKPAPCTSSNGPLEAFPAIGSPLDAYVALFGGTDQAEALERLTSEQGLLGGMMDDVTRARAALAGPERAKLDQMLDSLRELERQLEGRLEVLAEHDPPALPPGDLTATGLSPDVIRAQADIGAHAVAFGLTRVLHLSILGFNDHNAGWGALGHPGDAHEDLMHKENYTGEQADQAVFDITLFEAQIVERIWSVLQTVPSGAGTVADQTVLLWINSGGGKHHDGRNYHPVVLVGDAGGRLATGKYVEFGERPNLNQLYLSLAQATGMEIDVFGDPEDCPGPLSALG
ncbi:MAG: DUF1552 domain-containing protein [Myxococcota bacterium]